MTLEEINNIDDKAARLALLTEFIEDLLQEQRDQSELISDEELNATRDEALGMMSRFGKPGDR